MGMCENCEILKNNGAYNEAYVGDCESGLCLYRRAKLEEALKMLEKNCIYDCDLACQKVEKILQEVLQ